LPGKGVAVQAAVEELFERWRQRGDVAALAGVFDRTAPEIWRVARHLCGNRSEADDLLQAASARSRSSGSFQPVPAALLIQRACR
jgi:DNA-directed RNA polymerase specialized sigma24 family protein